MKKRVVLVLLLLLVALLAAGCTEEQEEKTVDIQGFFHNVRGSAEKYRETIQPGMTEEDSKEEKAS